MKWSRNSLREDSILAMVAKLLVARASHSLMFCNREPPVHRNLIQTTTRLPKPYAETIWLSMSSVRVLVMSCLAVIRTPRHVGVVGSNLQSSEVSPQHSSANNML